VYFLKTALQLNGSVRKIIRITIILPQRFAKWDVDTKDEGRKSVKKVR